jgi:hypothetical protein
VLADPVPACRAFFYSDNLTYGINCDSFNPDSSLMNIGGQHPRRPEFDAAPPPSQDIAAAVDELHQALTQRGFERQSAFGIRPVDESGGPYLHIVAAWIRVPLTDAGTVYSPQVGYVQAADGAAIYGGDRAVREGDAAVRALGAACPGVLGVPAAGALHPAGHAQVWRRGDAAPGG